MVSHCPPDDPAAESVLDRGEVDPALPGAQVGDVGDPQDVGRRRLELSGDEVVGDADAGHPDRRARPLLRNQAGDRGLAHQPLHALAPNPNALCQAQLGVDAPRAIDATVGCVDGLDALDQPGV